MRPSTLRPSIMTAEGPALLQREAVGDLGTRIRKQAKARPTALAAGSYGAARCCGATVIALTSIGTKTTIMLLVEGRNREELHAEVLRQLTHRGLRLYLVKDYGDTQGN